MEKIILIDGNSIMNKAYYALPKLSTSEGIITNAIHGFLNMLNAFYSENKTKYMVVCFDLKGPTFRKEIYKDYKANRKKQDEELNIQFPIIKEILKSMDIYVLEKQGYEADDLIGSLAVYSKNMNISPLILTGDRDLLQLVDDDTLVAYSKRGVSDIILYNKSKVKKDLGVEATQVVDYKALAGDSSDNIPGVKGVGNKTAISLLNDYGDLDNIYNNLGILKARTIKLLEESKELAYISQKLAKIKTDVDVSGEIKDYEFKGFDNEKSFEILKKYELEKIIELMFKEEKKDLKYSTDISLIDFNKEVYIDGLNLDEELFFLYQDSKFVKSDLKDIDEINIIGYNVKKLIMTTSLKDKNYKIVGDLSLINYCINPEEKDSILEIEKFEDQTKYLLTRVDRIKDEYEKKLETLKESNLFNLYSNIEMPLMEVLIFMEKEGFRVDTDYLKELNAILKRKLENLEEQIYSFTEDKFNIKSPMQLAKVLFEELQLPIIKKTKTSISTNRAVLDILKTKHPIIPLIIDHRTLTKLRSTYVNGIKKYIINSKVHTEFKQDRVATGRLSSINPNLQNIPIRFEEGRLVRKMFVPSDSDGYIVSADYSQIELRLLAHLSNDPIMIKAFINGEDIHKITASNVFGVDVREVSGEQRRRAKAVNFGIIYGISPFGLANNIDVDNIEAKDYIDKYFEKYKDVKKYLDSLVLKAEENGFVETIFNRKRYIRNIRSKNKNLYNEAKRVAMNMPIQGSAADIIKIAMIDVKNEMTKRHLKSKLILQVHDELIIDTVKEELEEVKTLLVEKMQNVVSLSIPLTVDVSVGRNWYECK